MPTSNNEDDKRPKLGPRLVPCIFVGYKFYPGGIWREEYLVIDFETFQSIKTYIYTLVGNYTDIELTRLEPPLHDFIPLILDSYEFEDPARRHPLLELSHPVSQSALRTYNQVGPIDSLVLFQEGDE